jgi:hypothetical protein
MKIEILAMKGPTVTAFELREPGILRVVLQMGTSKEELEASCRGLIHEDPLRRILRLWASDEVERGFLENGRHLIIEEDESTDPEPKGTGNTVEETPTSGPALEQDPEADDDNDEQHPEADDDKE